MRKFYSFVWWLILPWVVARLWWRGCREPGYRHHWMERFGFYRISLKQPVIWVHAVSVGETRAAQPLIDVLLAHPAQYSIVLTHMTPTGRATGQALFAHDQDRLIQTYCPYDVNGIVQRFIRHYRPKLTVLMETEVWPNMMAQCAAQGIPVVLVNARLSQRSFERARWGRSLILEAAGHLHSVAAQTQADAARFRQMGIASVDVTGNMKFDVRPSKNILDRGAELRQKMAGRSVLLCASTREGEEQLILNALKQHVLNNVLIVIVPRHPQRFDEVADMIRTHGFSMQRRSQLGEVLPDSVQVVLGDSMGELFAYYLACDVAYIGGSLLPLGGQNLIEAFMLGKPVLVGPHTFNFFAVTEDAIAAGCARRVADAPALVQEALFLLNHHDVSEHMGQQAELFAEHYRGATDRTMALLQPLLTYIK